VPARGFSKTVIRCTVMSGPMRGLDARRS